MENDDNVKEIPITLKKRGRPKKVEVVETKTLQEIERNTDSEPQEEPSDSEPEEEEEEKPKFKKLVKIQPNKPTKKSIQDQYDMLREEQNKMNGKMKKITQYNKTLLKQIEELKIHNKYFERQDKIEEDIKPLRMKVDQISSDISHIKPQLIPTKDPKVYRFEKKISDWL